MYLDEELRQLILLKNHAALRDIDPIHFVLSIGYRTTASPEYLSHERGSRQLPEFIYNKFPGTV
jgi:hypothetical protein